MTIFGQNVPIFPKVTTFFLFMLRVLGFQSLSQLNFLNDPSLVLAEMCSSSSPTPSGSPSTAACPPSSARHVFTLSFNFHILHFSINLFLSFSRFNLIFSLFRSSNKCWPSATTFSRTLPTANFAIGCGHLEGRKRRKMKRREGAGPEVVPRTGRPPAQRHPEPQ